MAFSITRTYGNDYRCSCCDRIWVSSPTWVDTEEEAYAAVSTKMPIGDMRVLREINVVDGTTGQVFAWARLSWPLGGSKSDLYSYTRWSGWGKDGPFEVIIKGSNTNNTYDSGKSDEEARASWAYVTDRSWDDICNEITEKKKQADLKQAEAELAKAQEKVQRLQNLS